MAELINHELDWLLYFWGIAKATNMSEGDFLLVCSSFLKTVLPLRYATRVDGSAWPKQSQASQNNVKG